MKRRYKENFICDRFEFFFSRLNSFRMFKCKHPSILRMWFSISSINCFPSPNQNFYFLPARGKKKKLKQLIPLLAIAKLKLTALIPLFLGIIAFAAAKALFLAKISLLVAGIIALKKLLASKHHEHESYEVVPHHEEHGHGWGRSADVAQNLAYSAHVKSD